MAIRFSFGKCKTRAGYAAKLQQKGSMDLEKIRKKQVVLLDTPILVVIKVHDLEIVVHSHGEVLFKNGKDVKLMEQTAREIYEESLK